MPSRLSDLLSAHAGTFGRVVPFEQQQDRLLLLDFTANNSSLSSAILNDNDAFSQYVDRLLQSGGYTYGIGGYNEHRTVYSRSPIFNDEQEPRRLHLGIDIWGAVDTPVYAPLDGIVHSFAFNNQSGDYGATIILKHQIEGVEFHTLYGHLGLKDLNSLNQGRQICQGQEFAHFGNAEENGVWPPHLHFQLVESMHGYQGDYPGVCRRFQQDQYLANSPDPDLVLGMMKYAIPGR
ncbi:peptidase M23 [Segetibacter sp. 3557_3]|uniref:peptidoglycan DD-metalloendopeptidase family protein n=1 Tax=Segetibacter sp. 3557_3 TaxID=2547429 RepID=UPI0010590706|nr:peptidoglycan DD-metalloendopeptidase family protein [Segetibacter sp. 3557_3]TDH22962.1 peptidase M23 [Segetibacter sp. 3557_3]